MFDEEQAVVELSAKGNGDNCEQNEINGDDGFRISNCNINSNIKSNSNSNSSNDIKRYTEIPKGSFDINRIGNAIAIWTLILVWFWISMYWILVYVPFPPMGWGSEDNVFAYSDYIVKPIAEKVRPLIQYFRYKHDLFDDSTTNTFYAFVPHRLPFSLLLIIIVFFDL
jgi:hypothetical protein